MPLGRHRRKRTIGHGSQKRLKPYYTVIVGPGPTEWHATDRTGPFSKLSRGAFRSSKEARAWARSHLGPHGWKIKRITETAFLGVK
jgi:hypothetical protein